MAASAYSPPQPVKDGMVKRQPTTSTEVRKVVDFFMVFSLLSLSLFSSKECAGETGKGKCSGKSAPVEFCGRSLSQNRDEFVLASAKVGQESEKRDELGQRLETETSSDRDWRQRQSKRGGGSLSLSFSGLRLFYRVRVLQ
jgi:hypothetical protein